MARLPSHCAVAALALVLSCLALEASAARLNSLFPLLPFSKISQFSSWNVAAGRGYQAIAPTGAPPPIPIDIAVPPGPPIVLPTNGPPAAPPGVIGNVPPTQPFDFPPPPPQILPAPGPTPAVPAFPPPVLFPPPVPSPPPPTLSPPPAVPPPTRELPPPSPTPSPPPAPSSCPSLPSDLCDFYFEGYQTSIPTFKVADGVGDTRISPPITSQVKGVQVDVIAANSANVDYLCRNGQPIAQPSGSVPGQSPDNQFYATQDAVQSRTFQPAAGGIQPYLGNLVLLNFTAVEFNIYNMVSNLNLGEDNGYFPQGRRCVLFNVGS